MFVARLGKTPWIEPAASPDPTNQLGVFLVRVPCQVPSASSLHVGRSCPTSPRFVASSQTHAERYLLSALLSKMQPFLSLSSELRAPTGWRRSETTAAAAMPTQTRKPPRRHSSSFTMYFKWHILPCHADIPLASVFFEAVERTAPIALE